MFKRLAELKQNQKIAFLLSLASLTAAFFLLLRNWENLSHSDSSWKMTAAFAGFGIFFIWFSIIFYHLLLRKK